MYMQAASVCISPATPTPTPHTHTKQVRVAWRDNPYVSASPASLKKRVSSEPSALPRTAGCQGSCTVHCWTPALQWECVPSKRCHPQSSAWPWPPLAPQVPQLQWVGWQAAMPPGGSSLREVFPRVGARTAAKSTLLFGISEEQEGSHCYLERGRRWPLPAVALPHCYRGVPQCSKFGTYWKHKERKHHRL